MKVVSVLLVTALLIIPATAARHFRAEEVMFFAALSKTPEQMAVIAVLIGVASVFIGLFTSLKFDNPQILLL